jgi:hypothetical protein
MHMEKQLLLQAVLSVGIVIVRKTRARGNPAEKPSKLRLDESDQKQMKKETSYLGPLC